MKKTFKALAVFILVAAFGLFLSGCTTQEYEITFNTDGGSSISSQTVAKNETATQPSEPTKDGYTFDGWYDEDGNLYDFSEKVTSNITLTAKWIENSGNTEEEYTVTFNSDGGSTVSSQTIAKDGKVTKPANPTKTGYTFKHWSYNNTEYDFNTAVTANMTLKAVWTQNSTGTGTNPSTGNNGTGNNGGGTTPTTTKYTVTFNLNGGTGTTPAAQTINKGAKASEPTTTKPTKSGYVFMGWGTSATATTAFNFASTAISKDTVLYAIWKAEAYSVTITDANPDDFLKLDALITIKKDGAVISASEIQTSGGVSLSKNYNNSKQGFVVAKDALSGVTAFKVLINGTWVNITK